MKLKIDTSSGVPLAEQVDKVDEMLAVMKVTVAMAAVQLVALVLFIDERSAFAGVLVGFAAVVAVRSHLRRAQLPASTSAPRSSNRQSLMWLCVMLAVVAFGPQWGLYVIVAVKAAMLLLLLATYRGATSARRAMAAKLNS